tara:strand:+ start:1000 stop:1248 length:249 start_codon:yes stop_codon:yes gene_type:complete
MTILGFSFKEVGIMCGMIMGLTGFYFTTDFRLAALEAEAADITAETKLDNVADRLIRIEANLGAMRKDLDKIEKHLEKSNAR